MRAQPLVIILVLAIVAACGPSAQEGNDAHAPLPDGTLQPDGWTPGADAGQTDGSINSDALAGCDPKNFTLQQAPPAEVYLVVDRSGSMNEPGAVPPATKWEELLAAMDLVLGQFQGAIKFGLLSYPSNEECNTPGPQVRFDLMNGAAIMTHLEEAVPAGGTPTAAALNNAASSLRALGSPESPHFIILATDGGPNCNYLNDASAGCACQYATPEWCCTNNPAACVFGHTCLDDTHTLDVIGGLHDGDLIDTFVIGLAGTEEYVNLLNAMATAGGRPQAGLTSYYPANNQAELQAALQSIAVSVISCSIPLEEAPDLPDLVRVYMDGGTVPRDTSHQNGWDYTDASHLEILLYGAACDALQDGQVHDVTATFACVVN